ncbi:hypothetical protein VPH35_139291 [Triticum aestivum]
MTKRSHATVLDDLPEWIVIEEILVRLPPKDLLRCRAVRKMWHSATSTDKKHIPGQEGVGFIVFCDNGAGASDQNLWPIIQPSKLSYLLGTCDGLLILAGESDFWICNPATRKCAPLPQPRVPSPSSGGSDDYVAGFYRHHPSGKYRVLWFSNGSYRGYILTVGSDKPRIISWPSVSSRLPKCRGDMAFDSCCSSQVNHRGSLHWLTGMETETSVDIMVFDTVTETFRWMRSSGQLGYQVTNDASIEIWMMQDYEAEAWALKYRINLLAMKTLPQFEYVSKMALLNQRELLIYCRTASDCPDFMLHCDIDGKFLGYVEIKEGKYSVYFTYQYFQESILPLAFCEMQEEGGVDKEPPFFIGL